MNNYKYKAFISYKHSVDKKNAEKIEFSLKKYGKSWFSPRRKIFRDEKILSHTLDLGSEINKALIESEYLIYFASPEGAESEWIELELDTWCNQLNRCDRLIIVITKGKIFSDENNINLIDWDKTNILPEKLKNNFTTIPYYRDISNIKEFNIDNPNYKTIINSIAARLENKKPEEMMDEAIKVLRRNRLLLNIAVFLLLTLTVSTLIFYNNSQNNLNEALIQKKIAKEKEKEAKYSLKKMKAAQEKEELQRFNDLEKRVIVIKNAKADPIILINKMIEIAENHKDSSNLLLKIVELKK